MKRHRIIIISLLSISLLMSLILSGCIARKTPTATTTTNPYETRISTLEGQVNQLQTKVANYQQSRDYSTDIAAIQSSVSGLQAKVNSLPASKDYSSDIANLQTRISDVINQVNIALSSIQSTTTNNTAAVWSRSIISNYATTRVGISCYLTPSQVNSEGVYAITLNLVNNLSINISDCALRLTLIPDNKIKVDSKKTFVNTINAPYTIWIVSLLNDSDGYCKSLIAESEPVILPANTTIQLILEFLMNYK